MKTHDRIGRRNRYRPVSSRSKSENPISPTGGDLLMMEAIHRHGPLSSVYLAEFRKPKFTSYQNTVRRLTILSHEANSVDDGVYLTRPPQQKRTEYAHTKPLVYDLAPAGVRSLKRLGRWSDYTPSNRNPWFHSTMVSAITASIELGACDAGIRYIPQHEILERSGASLKVMVPYEWDGDTKTAALIPDALFALDYGGTYRAFVVEADRCTEPAATDNHRRKSISRNVLQYRNFVGKGLYKKAYGIEARMLVINVTTSMSRMKAMLRAVEEICGVNTYLCHRAIEDFDPMFAPSPVMRNLLGEGWIRSGCGDIYIGKELFST